MRTTCFIAAALFSSLISTSATATRVGDFALIDHQGKFHQISRYGHQKAIVLVAQANHGCELIPGGPAAHRTCLRQAVGSRRTSPS